MRPMLARQETCQCGKTLTVFEVRTHKPSKWRLVDLETGRVYQVDDKYDRLLRDEAAGPAEVWALWDRWEETPLEPA